MRLCYVSHATSHFTRPYIDHFSRLGHEVHLVSVAAGDVPGAVNHHPVEGPIDPVAGKLVYLKAAPRVRAIVRSLRPCVVHAHYLSSNGLLAALAGVHPLIISVRGTDLSGHAHPLRRAALRFAVRRAELVNPVSRSFEPILRSLGVPPERLFTLTHGVEIGRLAAERPRRPSGPVRLLCTRRLSAHYDPHTILRALSRLQRRAPAHEIIFAAGGPQEEILRRAAAELGLSGSVTFLGGYGQDALPAILSRADVYVSAALTDGASISLLEAMASGLFPVLSDVPGNRDWVTGRGDGLLFMPGDDAALADRLQAAIEDEALRRAAVGPNRERVSRFGNRETNLAALERIYRDIAGA